jgi:hypothetical protein
VDLRGTCSDTEVFVGVGEVVDSECAVHVVLRTASMGPLLRVI